MSPKLKPLLLPQLVEERRKRESMSDSETEYSNYSFYNTQNSSTSDMPSPVTPTFSTRGHFRYPSSASSIESPYVAESPSTSPTFAPNAGKRSLPDVQEEPHERDDDFDMYDELDDLYDCLCDDHQCPHRNNSMVQSSIQLPLKQEFDYDLAEGFFSDGDYAMSTRSKKRRAIEPSPMSGLASRFGTRFPSFSRKWRLKKVPSRSTIVPEIQSDNLASRAASSRSSSISNSGRQTLETPLEYQMPPTPTKSIFGSREDISVRALDIDKANNTELEDDMARTPLLPPLMMDASANRQVDVQSPLQSPSVADHNDSFSGTSTPIDAITTPQLSGVPSPPLSNRPSISSFHHSVLNRPGHLIPSAEIPVIVIADPNDEWANKLGHANFTIQPEPYVPENPDLEACRQLRTAWDLARTNYTKHLVRTGEHYGVTSKTYKLTEQKWVTVDAQWRKNNELTIASTVENSSDPFATLKHTTLSATATKNVMVKIPSLNDPRSGNKFPQLDDIEIVGPMEVKAPLPQLAARLQRNPSKKAKLFKFFTEKFPASLSNSS